MSLRCSAKIAYPERMYQLRDYQKQAVDSAVRFFRKSREPAAIVLPTGAGKSLVIAELTRIAKGRVLVLAHVRELVEQNHRKYESHGLKAGIYSAGLGQKDWEGKKAVFGSVQSVARAPDEFFHDFSLLIIDECHRVADEDATQYQEVIKKLRERNPGLFILGLTATPYRMGLGWIYEYSSTGEIKTTQKRFFKQCVFELPLSYMIKNRYLTPPIKVDTPVTSYDFSELAEKDRMYTQAEVEEILKSQKHLTPQILKNIMDIADRYDRKGVMIFTSSVRHAREVLSHLPAEDARIVVGDTASREREEIIEGFKARQFKYLVNVSVLTTGFDAPHVDVIAILRPTESNSLYQQIVGRGLRLSEGKRDCYVLDYTGMGHDLYTPEISDKRPAKDSVIVKVPCPDCGFENHFWGYADADGDVYEHFGRKCNGGFQDPETMEVTPCNYRFRLKLCHACGGENDLSARTCEKCKTELVEAEAKLKQARLSKNAHILTPERITFEERTDKNGRAYLEIRYFDYDAQSVSEAHFFNHPTSIQKFNINFLRSHLRRPELAPEFRGPGDVIRAQKLFRLPAFVIARKQEKFWRITEKIFSEEMKRTPERRE
jgi:DNA repair protein RadD